MLKQLIHTFVALLAKINNSVAVEHFRPISLCNKILADRLKLILSLFILASQSAFVLGCVILENFVSALEIIHLMHCKSSHGGLMALKLDMAQAYVHLEWDFLLHVMQAYPQSLTLLMTLCSLS